MLAWLIDSPHRQGGGGGVKVKAASTRNLSKKGRADVGARHWPGRVTGAPHGRFESKQPGPSVKQLINSKSSGENTEELPTHFHPESAHFLSVCPLSASRESRLEEGGYICKSTGRGGMECRVTLGIPSVYPFQFGRVYPSSGTP